jgi:hypothetical protein
VVFSKALEPRTGGANVEFWWAYVKAIRTIGYECHVTMRNLDRALRQYAIEQANPAHRAATLIPSSLWACGYRNWSFAVLLARRITTAASSTNSLLR